MDQSPGTFVDPNILGIREPKPTKPRKSRAHRLPIIELVRQLNSYQKEYGARMSYAIEIDGSLKVIVEFV